MSQGPLAGKVEWVGRGLGGGQWPASLALLLRGLSDSRIKGATRCLGGAIEKSGGANQ